MSEIRTLNPQNVFGYFDDICAIPHGSGNMDGINAYLVDFAKAKGLEYYTDDAKNVIIIREATKGYENEEPIIMQAHIDMVCAAVQGKEIDFTSEGITPYIDGAYVKADGTTLGADNGIGAAMMLAVLSDNDLCAPRVEAVFTTNEETSMDGAFAIDLSVLKGRKMLNLDSEEEGIFTVSSAGGANIETKMPIGREDIDGNYYKIIVHGCAGGHSGAEIHRGRNNANQTMGRALKYLDENIGIRLVDIEGGKAHNIINTYCKAVVVADCDYDTFDGKLSEIEAIVRAEYSSTDPNVTLDSEKTEKMCKALDEESSRKVISYTFGAMHGIQYMSFDMPDLVESSMNFAIVSTSSSEFRTLTSVRSSVESRLDLILAKVKNLAECYGMSITVSNRYPGWEFAKESELRNTCVSAWTKLFGKTPEVVALHAGLECGIFMQKVPGLDAVAIGPQLYAVHSPDEAVEIASVEKTYRFICEVLRERRG